jgi:hypothetical protein
LWKGEVGLSDWLRIELRSGSIEEMALEPAGQELRLGRLRTGMAEPPHLSHQLFVSSRAAILRHDGVRWWLRRRKECHERVPTMVGSRVLREEEEAPLVHGTFLQIGQVRATFVDRRYSVPTVPAGVIDQHTGFLSRLGLEQELAGALSLNKATTLLLLATHAETLRMENHNQHPPLVQTVVAIHRLFPKVALMHDSGTIGLLFTDGTYDLEPLLLQLQGLAQAHRVHPIACGHWSVSPKISDTAKELELALTSVHSALASGETRSPLSLRGSSKLANIIAPREYATLIERERNRTGLLFGIEESEALNRIGPHVLSSLEQELCAVIANQLPTTARVSLLAQGVVGAMMPPGADGDEHAITIQRDWHFRPPIVDGQVEFPRSLCWEHLGSSPLSRAQELSAECADPSGVLSALSGGLPYPIAGRVALATTAISAVERIKLLFDVLEGVWRFVACCLTAAYFASPHSTDNQSSDEELFQFARSMVTRGAYPLGKWRELARIVAKGFANSEEPIGKMARDLLRLRDKGNETLEALGNQLHPMRNQFAHNAYPEARAIQDIPLFEQITRELLRALRPLRSWTLVTVEKTEPDLYGDTQSVDYVDHTGPSERGTRRRIGLKSPLRLANVVYLARFRDGLMVPMEPFVRRRPRGNAYELFWLQHLPRPGVCEYSSVVDGEGVPFEVEERKLPPKLRMMLARLQK